MIVDEELLNQRFFNDLLRSYRENGAVAVSTPCGMSSIEYQEILQEIEMSDPDFGDTDYEFDFPSFDLTSNDPFIAVTKTPLSDSRKKWKFSRFVIGTKKFFSA